MGKNVLIPQPLFMRIAELLQCWNISGYGLEIRDEYDDIMNAIELKIQKLELRKSYSKIIRASDEDKRDWARIDYLQKKALIKHISGSSDYS